MKSKLMWAVIIACVFFSNHIHASETNEGILDGPYDKVTQAVLSNFKEQRQLLFNMKKVDRKSRFTLMLTLLNQVVRERDLDFDPDAKENIVFANVSPPQGKWRISGVTPSAITNAEDRMAYERVIRINHEKYLHANFEVELRKFDEEYSDDLRDYFHGEYRTTSGDANELDELLNLIEDEKHRVALREKLKDLLEAKK